MGFSRYFRFIIVLPPNAVQVHGTGVVFIGGIVHCIAHHGFIRCSDHFLTL